MRKILTPLSLVALIFTLWASFLNAQETRNVLFIGNSYTEVNNLPQMIQKVALSAGQTLTYQSSTPGGCTFMQHCNNQSMTLIQQGGWDVVVLQEQSQYPSFPQGQVEAEVFPYAQQLVEATYNHNNCPEPMFYMTWGRKNGDPQNAQYFPVLGTYEGMDSMLYERYMYMAHEFDASVSPVGRVWRFIRENYPNIELYSSDGSHPSIAGSYAAACSFFTMIFRMDPTLIHETLTLDPTIAETIRQVAKNIVWDNIEMWSREEPHASLSYQQNNSTITFSAQGSNGLEYRWNFGDGSDEESGETVSHTFNQAGNYNVRLVAIRHCISDTASIEVTIDENGGSQEGIEITEEESSLRVFPNPCSGMVTVTLGMERGILRLVNLEGKVMIEASATASGTTLDLGNLPRGVYFLEVRGDNGQQYFKKLLCL